MNKVKITFFGGAGEVTGASHLLEFDSGKKKTKILIDCGLFQGSKENDNKNDDAFEFDPKTVDALIVTHAHADHSGRIPKLVHDGFSGKIYSSFPTKDFSAIMLADGLSIMKRRSQNKPAYTEADIQRALSLWTPVEYHDGFKVGDFNIILMEAGHILGSAMVEIKVGKKKIIFSGDLGNLPNPVIRDTEKISNVDYLIMEGLYGDSEHGDFEETKLRLERIIEDTINNKGTLMIPAFSLERTQKLLFEINNLVEHGRIPKVPIFLDSPLAIKATNVYKKHQNYYNDVAKEIIRSGDELFNFPGLRMMLTTEDSKSINDTPSPKIIIAGSGMCTGGRIIHHLKRHLPEKNSTVMLIGYQAIGTLGRQLKEGFPRVRILGEMVPVEANIEVLHGYSAHADMSELLNFVTGTADSLEKVFIVQAELKAALFFSQRLKDNLALYSVVPKIGESFELDI